MAVVLKKEYYCDNCDKFEPEVEVLSSYYGYDTFVTCKNRYLCMAIEEHVKKEAKKKHE